MGKIWPLPAVFGLVLVALFVFGGNALVTNIQNRALWHVSPSKTSKYQKRGLEYPQLNVAHLGAKNRQFGVASFYGNGERLNHHTASGEVFNPKGYTCASYAYPLNRRLQVTNVETGNSVVVKVNDRGPARRLNRLLDLTPESFSRLSSLDNGLVDVKVEEIW